MQATKLIYIPEARVSFTAEEVNALFAASEAHYDGLCRQQSQPGGLLWGIRNRIEYPPIEQCLPIWQVDLLAKIAEQLISVGFPGRIQGDLHKILNTLNNEYLRLNP